MRKNETPEEWEARRVARVAKSDARREQEEAAVLAALGEGWMVTGSRRRGYVKFILSPLKTASDPVTTVNSAAATALR